MDRDFIEALAADMIFCFDQRVFNRLNESARVAAGLGDHLSAKAWREVAERRRFSAVFYRAPTMTAARKPCALWFGNLQFILR
jgi:hypothetical protein